MADNYSVLVQNNLDRLYRNLPEDLAAYLPGRREGDRFFFNAFGEKCTVAPGSIVLGSREHAPVYSLLISLYALNASPGTCIHPPFRAFREFPGSMPYAGAFASHTEQVMVPYVDRIKQAVPEIINTFDGEKAPGDVGGDVAFVVYPLPKIALCYLFYEADEDFAASATCLFSTNADEFMPLDGLADVGEYSSKKILSLITKQA